MLPACLCSSSVSRLNNGTSATSVLKAKDLLRPWCQPVVADCSDAVSALLTECLAYGKEVFLGHIHLGECLHQHVQHLLLLLPGAWSGVDAALCQVAIGEQRLPIATPVKLGELII